MNEINSKNGAQSIINTSIPVSPNAPKDDLNKSINSKNIYILNSIYSKDTLNLKQILQLFNCAISQEQAWAVLYQVLNGLKYLLDNDFDTVKLNQDDIDINVLNINKDGSVLFGFKKLTNNKIVNNNNNANTNQNNQSSSASSINTNQNTIEDKQIKNTLITLEQEKHTIETKALKSVAYLIFDALDYGNNYSNEPVLQNSLSQLLLLISGHYREYSNNKAVSEDDEGYEQEEEDSIGLEKAIEICNNSVAEPEYHYRAVCRGLYAQAFELKAFLAKIEDSKNILQKSGKDTTHYCFEVLDKTDWAKLWMQVIHELRNGVKLRKVCEKADEFRRHIEYELTPFEILLDQIRARRYHLKKVSLDNSLGPEIKKEARDIILEFIRSRPPLRKSSLRTINKNKPEPLNLHEQLMLSIRSYSKPSLRKTHIDYDWMCSFKNSFTKKNNENNDTSKSTNESINKKRLLKADKKLLNNLTSSDDDDSDIDYEELKNLPILQEEMINESTFLNNGRDLNEILVNISKNYSSQRKKRIKAPDSLKSPLAPWQDPVESWRALVTEDVLIDANNKLDGLRTPRNSQPGMVSRRHTMNIADINSISSNLSSLNIFSGISSINNNNKTHNIVNRQAKVSDHWKVAKSRLTTPIYFKSGPGYDDFGFVSTQELIKKLTDGTDCLKLTFDELCHIRNVLTKAELDYLLFDNQLFQDVSKGKVCFSCRKTKFHIFNWGTKCRICQQRICKKCLRNAQLKNGNIAQVPLFKLCPSKFENKEDVISHNSNSSISSGSQTTNEELDNNQLTLSSSNEKFSNILDANKLEEDTNSNDLSFKLLKQKLLNEADNLDNIILTNDKNFEILEICVDCYQMMDGVTVSTGENESPNLNNNNNKDFLNGSSQRKMNISNDLRRAIHLNNRANNKNYVYNDSSPSCSSPESSITMQSLTNIDNVNNVSSPIFNKITLSHHSTPTPSTTPMLNVLNQDESDLSTIIINENNLTPTQFDSLDNSTKFSQSSLFNSNNLKRKNLTLDLQPVYSNPNS